MDSRVDVSPARESGRLQPLSPSAHSTRHVVGQPTVVRSDEAPCPSSFDDKLGDLLLRMDPADAERFFGESSDTIEKKDVSNRMSRFLIRLSQPGALRESFRLAVVNTPSQGIDSVEAANSVHTEKVDEFVEREERVQAAFRMHKDRFPPQIWNCCHLLCIASIAIDPVQFRVFDELLLIHTHAEQFHAATEKLPLLNTRRRGVGASTLTFTSLSRSEREASSFEEHGTARQKALREFAIFVGEVLPYLYAQADSPRGTRLQHKLCTQAICCLLGVSRNFLYNRRIISNHATATEDELSSIIDTSGLRMRQHRRIGHRGNNPEVQSLPTYDCGCDVPCFADVPTWTLLGEYEEFAKLSQEMKPRHKENRHLLNRLYCPLSNSTTKVCNKALSALYNVSEAFIADVRRTLDGMCSDTSRDDRPLLRDSSMRYQYDKSHPINRYPNEIREKVENHLDMVLRADPAGSTGASVCRVYSPEINTQEKLRKVLRSVLALDESVEADLSASTLQRMVQDYLVRRNYSAISFTQSDHNACPNCKTMQYAILQFNHEASMARRELEQLTQSSEQMDEVKRRRLREVSDIVKTRIFQEEECLRDMRLHNGRDKRIRGTIKELSDHFRSVENRYRGLPSESAESACWTWNSYPGRGLITHQDDMTKVDLPHFVVSASSDITRWRFDANAHVNAVTNDATIFSHDQGSGPKNSSSIVEEILLNHLVQCRGESIKVIVSDNASVGKIGSQRSHFPSTWWTKDWQRLL